MTLLKSMLLLTLSMTTLLGCGLDKWQKVKFDWHPNKMSISCADPSSCPGHQGVLFGYKVDGDTLYVQRCSGSLYGPSEVISAEHCNMPEANEMFFLTVPFEGHPSRLIHAHHVTGRKTLDLDYADFHLDEAVLDRPYVHPLERIEPASPAMVAFVVNVRSPDSDRDFKLDALHCNNKPNRIQKLTADENPLSFIVQDCTTIEGNSGGVLVSPRDMNAAYGLVTSGPKESYSIYERLQDFGLAQWSRITNMRCASLPGWPQVTSSCVTPN